MDPVEKVVDTVAECLVHYDNDLMNWAEKSQLGLCFPNMYTASPRYDIHSIFMILSVHNFTRKD